MTVTTARTSDDGASVRLATRLGFLIAGVGIACWAPLVPDAKARLGVDDGTLGLLLLCLGAGSVVAMLAAGAASARYGSKPVILAGSLGLCLFLPALAIAGTPLTLALALFGFGAALGALDVAINIHGIAVERAAGRPLMSNFHALFSIGGFVGAGATTGFIAAGSGPLLATLAASAGMAVATAVAWPRLLAVRPAAGGALFAVPRGAVLVLAVLAAIAFLAEGAVLDWSALYVAGAGLLAEDRAGLGFVLFSIAMTAGRLGGDRAVARLGDRATLVLGSLLAAGGFALLLVAPIPMLALGGFLAIGLGASNIVPVLFRRAGAQTSMPVELAVAAVTTAGYAGLLVGPAAIGLIADRAGLAAAFWLLAALLCLIALAARAATRERP